jgi:peptide/nickel transport system permease protein
MASAAPSPAVGEASRAATEALSLEGAPPIALPQRRAAVGVGFYTRAWRKFRRDRMSVTAGIVLLFILLSALLAPFITETLMGTNPETMVRDPATGRFAVQRPPSPGFWLGTDDLGRDALTRLLHAGRVSLLVGFLVAAISVVVGTAAGLVAGFFGSWVDDIINALVQFVFNIPSLFVLIALSVIFRPDPVSLALIFAFFFWPGTARQVRGVAQSARSHDYVDAARVLGASSGRIMFRHILPNVANIVLVVAGFDVAAAILGESALSFLGFGVQVPLASWGNMLSGSQDLFRKAPWLVYPPGVMILLTVLCVVLLADGLRDALDPRVTR